MLDGLFTRDRVFFLFSGICFVMFFIGDPYIFHNRSFRLAWNLGHVPIFFLWTRMAFRWWPGIRNLPFHHQLFRIIAITVFLSILIEMTQSLFGRYADINDVIKNMLGAILALTIYTPPQVNLPRKGRKLIQVSVIVWLLFTSWPMVRALCDEIITQTQFPVLGAFETPFERARWIGSARLSQSSNVAFQGKASLKIAMNTTTYSGASLKHFPRDWRGYRYLDFCVYNPDTAPLVLTCRVHDVRHQRESNQFEDRFNKNYTIVTGWNQIRITLEDIRNAPKKRTMDLKKIADFSIFATRPPAPRTIYLDNLRLTK